MGVFYIIVMGSTYNLDNLEMRFNGVSIDSG